MITPGVYKHCKGKEYEVLYLAKNANNGFIPNNTIVVYKQLYNAPDYPKNTVWTRDLAEFEGFVEVDGVKVKRFVRA